MRKKLLTFLFLLFAAVMSFGLLACDEPQNNADEQPAAERVAQYVTIEYKDAAYNFTPGNTPHISYSADFTLVPDDFTVTVHYDNGESEVLTGDFGLSLFDMNQNLLEAFPLNPDTYYGKVTVGDIFCDFVFVIDPLRFTDTSVNTTLQASYPYDVASNKVEPEISVYYGTTLLTAGIDYAISYGDNNTTGVNAGSVILEGMGIYDGTLLYNFNIDKLDIEGVTFTDKSATFTGASLFSAIEYDVMTAPLGFTGVSYDVYNADGDNISADDCVNVGDYTVIAHFTVNTEYYNELSDITATLTVSPCDIGEISFGFNGVIEAEFKNSVFTKDDIVSYYLHPSYSCDLNYYMLAENVDYSIVMNSGDGIDNFNVSNNERCGSFTVTGMGNFCGESTIILYITPYDFNNHYVESVHNGDNVVYDGTVKTIPDWEPYVLFGNDEYYLSETDYDISYENNVYAGSATVTFTGKGNFTGSSTATLYIDKATVSLANVGWNKNSIVYSGTDHGAEFTLINVPELVLVCFYETYKFSYSFGYNQEQVSVINGGNYYVVAFIKLIDQDNFDFEASAFTYYDDNEIKIAYIQQQVTVLKALATPYIDGYNPADNDWITRAYEYNGTEIKPTPSVMIGNKEITSGWTYEYNYVEVNGSGVPFVSVGYYVVYFSSQNYRFSENYMEIDDSYPIYYLIHVKAGLTNETLTWPTVYRYVFDRNCYYAMAGNDGSVLLNGEPVPGATITLARIYDDQGNQTNDLKFVFSAPDYYGYEEVFDKSTAVVISPFTSFKINGVEQTITAIDALDSLDFGDYVEITCVDDAHFMFSTGNTMVCDGQTIAFFVGNSKNSETGEYEMETEGYFYATVNNSEFGYPLIVGGTLTINRTDKVFSKYEVNGVNYTSVGAPYITLSSDLNTVVMQVKSGYRLWVIENRISGHEEYVDYSTNLYTETYDSARNKGYSYVTLRIQKLGYGTFMEFVFIINEPLYCTEISGNTYVYDGFRVWSDENYDVVIQTMMLNQGVVDVKMEFFADGMYEYYKIVDGNRTVVQSGTWTQDEGQLEITKDTNGLQIDVEGYWVGVNEICIDMPQMVIDGHNANVRIFFKKV